MPKRIKKCDDFEKILSKIATTDFKIASRMD